MDELGKCIRKQRAEVMQLLEDAARALVDMARAQGMPRVNRYVGKHAVFFWSGQGEKIDFLYVMPRKASRD